MFTIAGAAGIAASWVRAQYFCGVNWQDSYMIYKSWEIIAVKRR